MLQEIPGCPAQHGGQRLLISFFSSFKSSNNIQTGFFWHLCFGLRSTGCQTKQALSRQCLMLPRSKTQTLSSPRLTSSFTFQRGATGREQAWRTAKTLSDLLPTATTCSTGLDDVRKKSHQQGSNTRGHSTRTLARHNHAQEHTVTHLLLHGHIVQGRLVPRPADPAQNLAHVG